MYKNLSILRIPSREGYSKNKEDTGAKHQRKRKLLLLISFAIFGSCPCHSPLHPPPTPRLHSSGVMCEISFTLNDITSFRRALSAYPCRAPPPFRDATMSRALRSFRVVSGNALISECRSFHS